MAEPNEPQADRRRFFAASFGKLLQPLASAIEKRLPIALPVTRDFLRPPGAIDEKAFLDTCYRCGACADACPAKCIRLMTSDDENLRGTPTIDADLSACVVCDELACMSACPSGALQRLDRFAIRMGLATLREEHCVRRRGEDCRICIDRCPLGSAAIGLDEAGRVRVNVPTAGEPGCVGCGVCQYYCPTTPKAIVVTPRSA